MIALVVSSIVLATAPTGTSGPAKPASKPGSTLPKMGSGPLDFRCDGMRVTSKPNRVTCEGNVIVRRADLLVCCELFEGVADEKWSWLSFVCKRDVRGARVDELMWSQQADFDLTTGVLVLTGKPRLQRGASLVDGERVVIETETERARIDKPQGRITPSELEAPQGPASLVPLGAELPAICPVPKTPKRSPLDAPAPTAAPAAAPATAPAAAPGPSRKP